jgi:hypothetical protein
MTLLLRAAAFDDGDLRISAMQLKMFLDEAVGSAAGTAGVNVPFDALRYTAGECNYGKFSNKTAAADSHAVWDCFLKLARKHLHGWQPLRVSSAMPLLCPSLHGCA